MHEAAEMQPGGRTSLQSGSELGAESTLLFFLRGTSHQKLPYHSSVSEHLDFEKFKPEAMPLTSPHWC